MIIIQNVREALSEEYSGVYVGRGRVPVGYVGADLGNPLPVRDKGRWTAQTEAACQLMQREDPTLQAVVTQARNAQGFEHGQAARLYLTYLRARCRTDSHERRTILNLAGRVLNGERIALGCWCFPSPCHAQEIRTAVLAYGTRLHAQPRESPSHGAES